MIPQEIADYVFINLEPDDTAEFAQALQDKLMTSYSSDILKIIADQLETMGITIANIPCKRHPT